METEKKKSPWVTVATVLGAVATAITAIAALLSAMDVEKVVDKNDGKNELMLKSLFNYSTTEIGDMKAALGRIEGELDILRDICAIRPECAADFECKDGHTCRGGRCVQSKNRSPAAKPYSHDDDVGGAGSVGIGMGSIKVTSKATETSLKDKPERREGLFQAIQQKAKMGEAWDGDWKALEESAPAGE